MEHNTHVCDIIKIQRCYRSTAPACDTQQRDNTEEETDIEFMWVLSTTPQTRRQTLWRWSSDNHREKGVVICVQKHSSTTYSSEEFQRFSVSRKPAEQKVTLAITLAIVYARGPLQRVWRCELEAGDNKVVQCCKIMAYLSNTARDHQYIHILDLLCKYPITRHTLTVILIANVARYDVMYKKQVLEIMIPIVISKHHRCPRH